MKSNMEINYKHAYNFILNIASKSTITNMEAVRSSEIILGNFNIDQNLLTGLSE
jgi:hypothetical protein